MLRTLEVVPHPLNILHIICLQSLTVSDLSLNCLPEISWYQLLCLSSGNTSVTNCSSWTLDTNKTSLQLQVNDNDDEWSSSLSDAIMVMSLRKGRLGTCWSDRPTIDMRKTFVTRAVITYHQRIANVILWRRSKNNISGFVEAVRWRQILALWPCFYDIRQGKLLYWFN